MLATSFRAVLVFCAVSSASVQQPLLSDPGNTHAHAQYFDAFNGDSASPTVRITGTANGSLFLDELGRTRIFRGTNVVYKKFPYIPDISHSARPSVSFNHIDVSILRDHAVTAIRLGVMWPGVEPTRGNYNHTYLEIVKSIVQMCDDAGIYILLDFHQDTLSEKFCGEGVPPFAAQPRQGRFGFPFPLEVKSYPVDKDGIPSTEDCNKHAWSIYQGSQAVSEAYQRLYDNYDNLRDAFIDYWKLVAVTLLPYKNILGYDLINEPWNGNVFRDPSLSNALVANRKNLQPFYDVVAEGIRAVDPNALIFFEPVTTVQKSVGFTKVPGSSDSGSKSVLSYHYYTSVNKQYDIHSTIGFRTEQAAALGCGSLLSEFEMGWMNGTNISDIRKTSQAADHFFASYTGWEYTDYIHWTGTNNGIRDPETGKLRPDMATVYSRPYANAIAGLPTFMQYDDDTGLFTLKFIFNGKFGEAGITEIRTNFKLHYPHGFDVSITASLGSRFTVIEEEKERNEVHGILRVARMSETLSVTSGEEVTVVISKKAF